MHNREDRDIGAQGDIGALSSRGRGSGDSGTPGNRNSGSGDGSSAAGRGGRGAFRGVRRENMGTIHKDLFTRPEGLDKKGTAGTVVKCRANFIQITRHPKKHHFQYHVGFVPEIDSKQMRVEIVREQCSSVTGKHVIFDGMILYMPDDRLGVQKEFSVVHPVSKDTITVTFRQSVQFGHNDPQAINIYNLLIRDAFKAVGFVQIARNFFDPKRSQVVEKYGVEVWPGYETAVRMYEEQLMLCIENRFKVLRRQTVFEQMGLEFDRARRNMETFRANCEMTFVGQTILTLYNNRMHRLSKFDFSMSPNSTFMHAATNREITFAQYFKEAYNVVIKDMSQPLIVSEGKPKQPGEAPQVTYLVPELCYVTGLTDTMRKDTRVMKALSEHTRMNPQARSDSTGEFLRRLSNNPDIRETFEAWDLQLGNCFVELPARQLPAETLIGQPNSNYTGVRAEWAKEVKRGGNFRTCHLANWIVLCPNTPNTIDLALKFIEECKSLGRQMGMNVADPLKELVDNPDALSYSKTAQNVIDMVGNEPIHMMVIILNDDNKTRYDVLKKLLCNDRAIPSQMVLASTLAGKGAGENKNFGSIVLKILVQMNCKMGGAIWKVNIPLKKTMIVGYDLYHDSTMKGKTVGACVSSYDGDFTQWFSQALPHGNPVELGDNLRIFIKKALRKYFESNNNELPERILLYRDGCGDGQIPLVRDQEVRQVQEACAEVGTMLKREFPVKLSFTVITKKVNMRVFRNMPTALENPMPGTVVDSVVTRPERYDFYLVPQFVNQGTVTPVCYNIIHDDTGMQPDQHQRLAFKLCHLYYNWQGTVRVPAPCQYAHKLAFLVAQSLHKESHKDLRDKLFFL